MRAGLLVIALLTRWPAMQDMQGLIVHPRRQVQGPIWGQQRGLEHMRHHGMTGRGLKMAKFRRLRRHCSGDAVCAQRSAAIDDQVVVAQPKACIETAEDRLLSQQLPNTLTR